MPNIPEDGTPLTKAHLEMRWQMDSKFARQCADDYKAACKEFGNKSTAAISAWKRFQQADKERKESEAAWLAN